MRPVDQTIFDGSRGNCLQACVASFLELPLDRVPNFAERHLHEHMRWWYKLEGFMAAHELFPHILAPDDELPIAELVFVTGESPRGGGIYHCALFQGGRLVHDPHPSREGVLSVEDVVAWRRA